VIESLQAAWHSFLQAISGIVIPDWGALVALLPILLVIAVVGPIMSLLVLGWLYYAVRAPRARLAVVEGPVTAAIEDGRPVYPAGEPYCVEDQLVYPPGATRCDICHRDLLVRCPKCSAGRTAARMRSAPPGRRPGAPPPPDRAGPRPAIPASRRLSWHRSRSSSSRSAP
jgi:hypothetical protein